MRLRPIVHVFRRRRTPMYRLNELKELRPSGAHTPKLVRRSAAACRAILSCA